MSTNPYNQIGPFTHKRYDDRGHITPNFEFSEGTRPAGEFMPAPYLPSVRYNRYFEEFFVLSGGKVVAMDSEGYIVPAGLRKQATAYKAAFDGAGSVGAGVTAGDAVSGLTLYTADDVTRGVLNAKGVAVVAGEPVVKSFFTLTAQPAVATTTVSNPVGVSSYNYWAHPGGNGENPIDFNVYNFSLQNKVAFVCDYQIEIPIVADRATYLAAPFAGMGSAIAAANTIKPGMFVTYDMDSNYVLSADGSGYDYGTTTKSGEVVGQVLSLDTRTTRDLLDRVRTRYDQFGDLEKMPGTASGGKSDTLVYSAGYGLVRINLIFR